MFAPRIPPRAHELAGCKTRLGAMKKARAMLDSLMGPSRDQSLTERSGEEFREANVCKHYLVGYCPDTVLGKKLAACRAEFDRPSIVNPGCTKLHSVALRTEYQQHKDFAKFQREYEESLLKYLESIVREADGKAMYEKRKRDDMDITWEFHEKLCDLCGMKYKLEKKDGMLGSGLGQDCYKDDLHEETELHGLFLKMRSRCNEMKEKDRFRREQDKEAPGQDDGERKAGGRRSRSRGKDDGERKAGCRRSRSRGKESVDSDRKRKDKKAKEKESSRRRSKSRHKDSTRRSGSRKKK